MLIIFYLSLLRYTVSLLRDALYFFVDIGNRINKLLLIALEQFAHLYNYIINKQAKYKKFYLISINHLKYQFISKSLRVLNIDGAYT